MNGTRHALVTGAGGFIGGHLVRRLLDEGMDVRAVDCKPFSAWHQLDERAESFVGDLSQLEVCVRAVEGADTVYNLAADMGGMGFIENNKALCMLSVLPSTHMLIAARDARVERFFYSSSACVYPGSRQETPNVVPLHEDSAYPADPEDGYGWEKLFSERMARHFSEDFGLPTRIGRFHNVYGPYGTYAGGREKAPAAVCRKVIEAMLSRSDTIEVWGDGNQTRSFMYVDDCLEGIERLMWSDHLDPLNIGSSELVSINDLVDLVEKVAGTSVRRNYDLSAPQGVRGRNSDNTRIRQVLEWEPSTRLEDGIEYTFRWIYDEMVS